MIRITHESEAIEFVPDSVDELMEGFSSEGEAVLWLRDEIAKREEIKESMDKEIGDLENLVRELTNDISVKKED